MSDLALHEYLSRLPEEALQEFTEWCILEQAKEVGYDFTPDRSKLDNLPTGDYIHQLVDQFMAVKKNPIKDGLAAVVAGLQPLNLPRDFHTGELCCALFSECAQINPSFKEVLDKMVRFDYRQRYQDATLALEALQPLRKIYQVSTHRPNLTNKHFLATRSYFT